MQIKTTTYKVDSKEADKSRQKKTKNNLLEDKRRWTSAGNWEDEADMQFRGSLKLAI